MEFENRYLGRTGIRVSPLCLGCMMFGQRTEPEDSYRMIDRALEAGINFLDTANVYGTGRSEEVTGEALKRNKLRGYLVLASKCHGNMHKEGAAGTTAQQARLNPNRYGNSRRQIMEQCEQSLKRLKTDWIDLYQIHRPHPETPIDETLRALDDLVRMGKINYIGCSTFAAWQVVEALWCSDQKLLSRFVTEQPPYHLLDRRIERELIPMARSYDLGLIPWSPLAGGFLTGKYKRGADWPGDARFSDATQGRAARMRQSEKAFDIVQTLEALASEKGCTTGQLALAWCMNQPGITSPIIGPRTMEQLEDNLGALNVQVSDEDRRRLDEVSPPGEAVVPFYEANFGPQPYRW